MLLFTVFATLSLIGSSIGSPSKVCQDGETKEQGRYWYACQSGTMVMKGCLSEKHARLNNHDTFVNNGYVFECVQDSNGDYMFKYGGCLAENGQQHNAGDTWQDDNYWYTCSTEGGHVKVEIQGCIDDGRRLNPGDKTNKSDFIYECKRSSDGGIGWDIYPNPAYTGEYNPNVDHIHKKETVPPPPSNT